MGAKPEGPRPHSGRGSRAPGARPSARAPYDGGWGVRLLGSRRIEPLGQEIAPGNRLASPQPDELLFGEAYRYVGARADKAEGTGNAILLRLGEKAGGSQ